MYTLVSQRLSCAEECVCVLFNYLCELAVGVYLIREDFTSVRHCLTQASLRTADRKRDQGHGNLRLLLAFVFLARDESVGNELFISSLR